MTDDDQIAAIRARLAAATRGPWTWEATGNAVTLNGRGGDPELYDYEVEVVEVRHTGGCGCRLACELEVHVADDDARLIENAPSDIAHLLAVIDAQARALAAQER